MNYISNLKAQTAVVFESGNESLVLIKDKTNVLLITDETDFDKEFSGLITDLNEDFVQIENGQIIKWEYVVSVVKN